MDSIGRRFATALAAKDIGALRNTLADDVDFKGLTPGRLWEAVDAEGVVRVLLGSWFEDDDTIDEVIEVTDGAPVEDTGRVAYRLRVSNPSGVHTVEQQAYYRLDGGAISHLRVMCSGFRPHA